MAAIPACMVLGLFRARQAKASVQDVDAPWPKTAASLLDRIRLASRNCEDSETELAINPHDPDDPEQLRWVAGARDALLGGDADSVKQTTVRRLVSALGDVVRRPTSANFAHLYSLFGRTSPIGLVDGFLKELKSAGLSREGVAAVARRLANEAPDLNPVKYGIALLGTSSDERDRDLIMELGVYEELTLYAVVALSRIIPDPEPAIWALARRTHGWGRIQAIRRLDNPTSDELRSWLLTEGHRNTVMTEEIAYFCAVQGDLLHALRNENPSEVLLDAAGELLAALVCGGPAEDMNDYADGGEASRLFVQHANARGAHDLKRFLNVRSLQMFEAEFDASSPTGEPRGWTAEVRWAVRAGAASFLSRPEWRELVAQGLQKAPRHEFWPAAEVAEALNIDVWPTYFRRQRDLRSDEWYSLMKTDDPGRIVQVIDLAHTQLDLEKVGSGPTSSLGLGLDYADDNAVDFILQDLRRFPGLGWSIIEVGLRARTIRARNMAHKALAAWPRPQWPAAALTTLRTALENEPDKDVAERTLALIEGRSISHQD